jgi:triphosphoribosyl-dephospho-CoA synthase
MDLGVNVEDQLCDISEKAQFAMFLDILTPKPGNVHRYRDHPDTRFIHFAASITRLGYPLLQTAQWGYTLGTSDHEPSRVGRLIKSAVQASMEPHGKNTLLGTILLLVPLAAAAGLEVSRQKSSKATLHQSLTRILSNTDVDDAIELVRALQIASPGGAIPKSQEWTDESQAFDFQSPNTIELIRREKYSLCDLQGLAASYDTIAHEYTTNFAYTFDTLYGQVTEALNRHPRVEDAVLASYLWALSDRPDSFIQRKNGPKIAQDVMQRAKKLYSRIMKTPEHRWMDQITPFDDYLRAEGSQLNPGTTADLLSAALFLTLLLGNIKSIL